MAKNIDSLLHFVADYHAFCDQADSTSQEGSTCQNELSIEELEFVAAATQTPQRGPDPDRMH